MIIFPAEDAQVNSPLPTPLFTATASESTANEWGVINGWSVSRVYSNIRDEYQAISGEAGLIDTSFLIRYSIRGYDAAAMLAKLTTVPIADLESGEIGRGLILNDQGFVVDHADVTRLSGDLYLLTTSAQIDRRIQLACRGMDVEYQNISGKIAVLALVGPEARRIATKAGFEIAGGFLSTQSKVRGVEACVRPLMVGQVGGVEIIYPAEEALTLWERIRRACNVVPVGSLALLVLRSEAGLSSLNLDFDGADRIDARRLRTPDDLGLPHLAPLGRAWFNGRRALKVKPHTDRCVVSISADADVMASDAKIFDGNSEVGKVTSWCFSWQRRCSIGFADIMRGSHPDGVDLVSGRAGVSLLKTPEVERAEKFLALTSTD